ncbi:unnamed protein product [Schistocephalus solidus]|uniref:Pre-rRNA-processing protein TSR1 homolog n=1 Tax=Schistocephalus solidus TaxID=70667 RepID=A0A183S783_SCHSO|nr:unnamed protein product [Schistocephalus solidus]
MAPLRHVSGSLKQSNKKHKGEKKRLNSQKVTLRVQKVEAHKSKKLRKHLAKQQRQAKLKMVSSNQRFSRPLMCLLLPLHEGVDLHLTQTLLASGDRSSTSNSSGLQFTNKGFQVNYLNCPSIKREFALVNGRFDDLLGNLDLARLADWIIFVLPGDIRKVEPGSYSELLSALYAQGLPPSVFCVMSNISDTRELLAQLQMKFTVNEGKVRVLNSTADAFSLLRHLAQSQKKPTFCIADNYLSSKDALKVGITSTRLRCGMLVEDISTEPYEENEGEVFMKVGGILRGWDLPLYDISQSFTEQTRGGCPFLHLTGWGDFPLRKADWTEYRTGGIKAHQVPPRPNSWIATSGPDDSLASTLSAVWNEMQIDDDEEDESNPETDDDEMSDHEEVAEIPSASDDEADDLDLEESDATSKKTCSFGKQDIVHKIPSSALTTEAEKAKAAYLEYQFPDEYTLSQLRKLATGEVTDPLGYPLRIPSGSLATLTIGPMDRQLASALISAHTQRSDGARLVQPLVVWSLLPYERCLSVLHLVMQKRAKELTEAPSNPKGNTFDADPIMAKEPTLFQVGIRRFIAAPIYSQPSKAANTNSKAEKFFTFASSPIVASMYAPVAYAPLPVLQFRLRSSETGDSRRVVLGDLAAVGSVLSVDPSRAIIKRVLLSGNPYKINKRSVVARYMFYTPEDVEYFKPVQLHTKSGAVGHIKQSVGTHGLMKCLFDRQILASDVILMPLYKRIFPKMTYDSRTTAKVLNFETRQ